MQRTSMRSAAVTDEWGFMRARCLAHTDCRAAGRMVERPPGKPSWSHDLYTQSKLVQHLNENFKRHLVRRDKVDNTSLALLWKTSDKIHGPQAPFPEACGPVKPLPFTCVAVATPETATEQAASPDVDATGAGTPPATEGGTVAEEPVGAKRKRGGYKCRKCGEPKKSHRCVPVEVEA